MKARLERNRRTRRLAARGMTLVEIMIVVIIMALIATGVAYAVIPMLLDARIRQTESDVRVIQQAAQLYMVRHADECPSAVDDLSLASSARHTDAWGSSFTIDCAMGIEPVVMSPGPDRQFGTGDDITSTSHDREAGDPVTSG